MFWLIILFLVIGFCGVVFVDCVLYVVFVYVGDV